MITGWQAATLIVLFTLATVITRALPFIAFPPSKPMPPFVAYLGKVLPYAITGMLVVFCLKNTQVLQAPHGLPEAIGVLVVAGLYLLSKNTLVSIAGGTLVYMLLVQLVFV